MGISGDADADEETLGLSGGGGGAPCFGGGAVGVELAAEEDGGGRPRGEVGGGFRDEGEVAGVGAAGEADGEPWGGGAVDGQGFERA